MGVTDLPTPAAGHDDGDLALPRALDRTFAARRDLLVRAVPVPHPLGQVPAGEIDSVVRVRARAATQSYRDSQRALAEAIATEYQQLVPGERSRQAAADAVVALRPALTPSGLVALATDGATLARPVKVAATAYARRLVDGAPRANQHDWDLVVVDEYQRLPDIVLALLRRRTPTLLLSGDPLQSFAGADAAGHLATSTQATLRTSLRLPSAIAAWIDRFWVDHDEVPPSIRSAVAGGNVEEVTAGRSGSLDDRVAAALAGDEPGAAAVIAASSLARTRDDWLDATEAVGLEWPHVVLVDPERTWHEDGPAGVFIGASRAIDRLTVVS